MAGNIKVERFHTYTGHKDCIYALAQIDDTHFVSSGADGMVVMWDLSDLEKGTMIAKVPSSCYSLEYLSDQKLLIVGQNFEGIHIIDIEDKSARGSLKLNDSAIFDIKVDGDEAFVATGNGEVFHIFLPTLQVLASWQATDKSARTIAITADFLMIGYSDNFIRVYSRSKKLSLITEFEAHQVSVFSLVVDEKRGLLLSGSRDAHLKAWQLGTFELKHDIVAHMYAINHIAYSEDEQHFVTCSMDKSIKIWDAETFKLKKVIDKARHAGHGTSVNKLIWMPHKNYLVSGSDDTSIAVWDINMGQ